MEYNKEKRQWTNGETTQISALWNSHNQEGWLRAEICYWKQISDANVKLEETMEMLKLTDVEKMSVEDFYIFLYDTYFVWKYTAKNRLATTRAQLKRHLNDLPALQDIQKALFSFDKTQIQIGLEIASCIHGLGTAGASGLLSILFPDSFGTVDQFVVKSLLCVEGLEYHESLLQMKPEGLTIKDGVLLERILRAKSSELNLLFQTDEWTPRRIDKILWACRI